MIEHELGFEEIGTVYLGRHAVLPRHAEVKVMHAGENWLRAKAVQMLREACLLEALAHPGVPRVYECGVLVDKRPWSAFEHVDGTSFGTLLANGPMPLADVLELVRDVADILDHIHRRGIVHRKLSAEAIVRTPKRRYPVYVRHWGEACTLDAQGHIAIDARDDVHELGVIAFRALTGHMPDLGGNARDRYPNAPSDVARLLDTMLAIDPSDRPTSADVRERARNLGDVLARGATTDPGLRAAYQTGTAAATTAAPPPVDPTAGFSIRIGPSRTRTR